MMRRLAAFLLLLGLAGSCAQAGTSELSYEQAQKIATLVASHDNFKIDDRTLVLNSMDTRNAKGFFPGYYSFSIIHESDTAEQPDETVRVYIISKRTADTWEMNLCRHYSFPALEKMQQAVMKETGATPADAQGMAKDIGCASRTQTQSKLSQ